MSKPCAGPDTLRKDIIRTPMMLSATAKAKQPSDEVDMTPEKARKILHDGEVNGHPLTDKQRRFFGAIASGGVRKAELAEDLGDWLRKSSGGEKAGHKYIRRTGVPGHYTYEYPESRLSSGEVLPYHSADTTFFDRTSHWTPDQHREAAEKHAQLRQEALSGKHPDIQTEEDRDAVRRDQSSLEHRHRIAEKVKRDPSGFHYVGKHEREKLSPDAAQKLEHARRRADRLVQHHGERLIALTQQMNRERSKGAADSLSMETYEDFLPGEEEWQNRVRELRDAASTAGDKYQEAKDHREDLQFYSTEGDPQDPFGHVGKSQAAKDLGDWLRKAAGGSGEGSRGGHVTGHTASGKPIYAAPRSFPEAHAHAFNGTPNTLTARAKAHKEAGNEHLGKMYESLRRWKESRETDSGRAGLQGRPEEHLDEAKRHFEAHQSTKKSMTHESGLANPPPDGATLAGAGDKLGKGTTMSDYKDLDDWLHKSMGFPTGEPGPSEGVHVEKPQDGANLDGGNPNTPAPNSGSLGYGDVPMPRETVMSSDDLTVAEMVRLYGKDVLKGLEKSEAGMVVPGEGFSAQEITHAHAYAYNRDLQKAEAARYAQETIQVQGPIERPIPRQWEPDLSKARTEQRGIVQISTSADEACVQLLKAQDEFWADGQDHEPGILRKAYVEQVDLCKSCNEIKPRYLTACPHCHAGAVVNQCLPPELGGGVLEKSEHGYAKIRLVEPEPDEHVGDSLFIPADPSTK